MRKYLLPEHGEFYKANLHCHTTVSDGKLTPEEVKALYKSNGYSIVAYTDHDVMIPHPELADDDFLPLIGYEMEVDDQGENHSYKTCHMCLIALKPDAKQVCWNGEKYLFGNSPKYMDQVKFDEKTQGFTRSYTPECISTMMKLGVENGFFVTYNHPKWSLENYSNYMGYYHMNAMEIYNQSCLQMGYPEYNPDVYDDLLRGGRRIYCIGADDNHNSHRGTLYDDSLGSFTVIKAPCLEYRTITKALQQGHFYASQGPEIKSLWYEDGMICGTCSPAQKVEAVYDTRRDASLIAEAGGCVEQFSFPVKPDSLYVRITVTDHSGKHANSNAYFVDDLNK